MNYDFKKNGLITLKVIITLILGSFLFCMFVQTFAFEISKWQTEIAIFATIALMRFYKPLKEVVFGTGNFIKYVGKILLNTTIWLVITCIISFIGFVANEILNYNVIQYQVFRLCAILAFFVWYPLYRKKVLNKQKKGIEEVNIEEVEITQVIENEPEPKDQN